MKRNRRERSSLHVNFGEVAIREYERSIGDWWDIQHSLALGWAYTDQPAAPLPEEEAYYRKERSAFTKMISKAREKLIAWMLVYRKKRRSRGLIVADSLSDVQQKIGKPRSRSTKRGERGRNIGRKNQNTSYEDNKSTSYCREEVLINFGFSARELNQAEAERKILRLEYQKWSRERGNPSPILIQRCLADM